MNSTKRNTIIDLTKPLDQLFTPFTNGQYSDPPLEISEWSSISRQGFYVYSLSLGTQTGTHIDAPAHFLEEGASLEALAPDQLIGNYFLMDLTQDPLSPDIAKRLAEYRQEKMLFLRTPENITSRLSPEALRRILSLPPVLWVLSGEIEIERSAPFEFHRLMAGAGKYLVEDLDQEAAHRIAAGGELFVLPLRLIGVSGSPCRVMVRTDERK